MNMKKCNKKVFLSVVMGFCIVLSGFSQENAEPVFELSVNDELQKNFVILEPVRQHELNPQVTPYSSDSQILSGLYEGLFSYLPVTLEPQYAIATGYKISRDKKSWTEEINQIGRASSRA